MRYTYLLSLDRIDDRLTMEVRFEDSEIRSYVVAEVVEKFPCDVFDLPIYRNINSKGKYWTCDFLVVEINNIRITEYEKGRVIIKKSGDLEVVCPGVWYEAILAKKTSV